MSTTAAVAIEPVVTAEGDYSVMTQRRAWFKVNMRARFLPYEGSRFLRGTIIAVLSQNSVVIAVGENQHICTRVAGKNRFTEDPPS